MELLVQLLVPPGLMAVVLVLLDVELNVELPVSLVLLLLCYNAPVARMSLHAYVPSSLRSLLFLFKRVGIL